MKTQQKNGRTYAHYRRDEEQAARLRREWGELPAELRARAVPLHWVHSAERGGWTDQNGKLHPWADDRKAASAQKWNALPALSTQTFAALLARVGEDWGPAVDGWALTRNGLKLGPVGGVGVRLGSHAGAERWADGCLVAVDCDSEAKAADALEVLGAVLGCTGGAVARRVRKGSNRWAVLLRVKGLERPPKSEALHFEGDEMVELLGQGAYLAACYLHPSGQWVEWVEGEKTLPAPVVHDVTLEQFKAFKAALEKLPGAKGWPSETKAKTGAQAAQELGGVDRVAEWLKKHAPEWLPDVKSFVRGETPEGALDIFCPFGGHDDGTPSSTRYLPQGVSDGEREGPGFHCFHTSCPGHGLGVGGLRARIRELDPKFTLLSPEEVALFEVAGMSAPVALPKGFCTRDGWICKKRAVGAPLKLVRLPFEVNGGRVTETDAGGFMAFDEIKGRDTFGKVRTWTPPRGFDAKALFGFLRTEGLDLAPFGVGAEKPFSELVGALREGKLDKKASQRPGWQSPRGWKARPGAVPTWAPVGLLPDGEAIGVKEGQAAPILVRERDGFASAGTVADWRDKVGALLRGQSKALIALGVPFLAAVGRLVPGWKGFFLILTAPSSKGKSSISWAVASVDGQELDGACDTARFFETRLIDEPDQVHFLDDLKKDTPKGDLQNFAMMANGWTRGRLGKTQDKTAFEGKKAPSFFACVLGSSECTFEEICQIQGVAFQAGSDCRAVSFSAYTGDELGCFSTLPEGFDSPKKLAEAIEERAQSYRGAVGRAFRRRIAETFPACLDELKASAEAFKSAAELYGPKNGYNPNALASRLIGQVFGQLFACLDWANRELSLGFGSSAELREVFLREAFLHVRKRKLENGSTEENRFLDALDALLYAEKDVHFETLDSLGKPDGATPSQKKFGVFFRRLGDGRGPCFCIPSSVWKQEILTRLGVDSETAKAALQRVGALLDKTRFSPSGGDGPRRNFTGVFIRATPEGALNRTGQAFAEGDARAVEWPNMSALS